MNTQALLADWEYVQTALNERFQVLEPFKTITKKTNLLPAHVFLSIAFVAIGLISFDIGGAFLTSLIGFVFPAYRSLVTVENGSKADSIQWTAYWLLFASFSVVEEILNLGDIQFYYLSKLMFLVWCMLPSTKGATLVYEQLLQPLGLHSVFTRGSVVETKEE